MRLTPLSSTRLPDGQAFPFSMVRLRSPQSFQSKTEKGKLQFVGWRLLTGFLQLWELMVKKGEGIAYYIVIK